MRRLSLRLVMHLVSSTLLPGTDEHPAGGRFAGRVRTSQGRSSQVHLRAEQDLPRHCPRLLDLRAEAIRPGQTGVPLCQSRRHSVSRSRGLRPVDPQEGDAGRDRRVRHARPGQGRLQRGARSVQSQFRVRRAGAATTFGSCWTNCFPKSRRKRRPTAGRSSCRAMATTALSPAPAAARSARSRPRGSGPIRSGGFSARSAPMSACAGAMSTRP